MISAREYLERVRRCRAEALAARLRIRDRLKLLRERGQASAEELDLAEIASLEAEASLALAELATLEYPNAPKAQRK